MHIKKIAHICLNVKNLDATTRFYHGGLKLPIRFTFMRKDAKIGVYFDAGNDTFIEAFEHPDVKIQNTGIVHFCLEVDDMDAAIADIEKAGITVTGKKAGCDGSIQAWIEDPDGTRIELHQYTPASAQKAGGIVQVNWT
jgi:glyoxylase I family protein